MQQKVVEFTNLLRKSGIRVSVVGGASTRSSSRRGALDLRDREVFKDALRASMVKRGDEIPTFDELFDLYWSGLLRQPASDSVRRSRQSRWATWRHRPRVS